MAQIDTYIVTFSGCRIVGMKIREFLGHVLYFCKNKPTKIRSSRCFEKDLTVAIAAEDCRFSIRLTPEHDTAVGTVLAEKKVARFYLDGILNILGAEQANVVVITPDEAILKERMGYIVINRSSQKAELAA